VLVEMYSPIQEVQEFGWALECEGTAKQRSEAVEGYVAVMDCERVQLLQTSAALSPPTIKLEVDVVVQRQILETSPLRPLQVI